MSVLVLGGSGFIGSHILEALAEQRHNTINLSRSPSIAKTKRSEFIQADFQNTAKLSEALQSADTVIHCISDTVPATSAIDPVHDINSNLIGTVRLLELIKKQNQGIHLIYISSGGTVYGSPSEIPVKESAPLNPISSYGAVKVAIEKFIGVATSEWGLQATILRPSNPYGERQGHKGVQGLIGTILNRCKNDQSVTIYGDGSITRDYLYVKDLASLVAKAVSNPQPGIYNCGSGQGHSINQIVSIIETVAAKKIERAYSESRRFDVEKIVLCTQKARDTFNWQCETQLEEGIARQYSELEAQ